MSATAPLQVLFCTGQSDPRSCALSPTQRAFLDGLDLPAGVVAVPWNFPYARDLAPHRPTPLWVASLRHLALAARIRLPGWAIRHRDGVERQLRAAERTLVLAGSIGLDLLGRLDLPRDVLDRLVVVAYGAVATRPPDCRTLRFSSRDDLVARWAPGAVDTYVDAGHLDYLGAPELTARCRALVSELLDAEEAR